MVVAGGGTGGHLFPGVAIAEEFLRRDPTNRILFIGTDRGLERKVLDKLGLPLQTLNVEGIKGRGVARSAAALLKIPGSLIASCRILRVFQPDIVVGVGGYASGPAVLAARLMGLKTAIAEQNAYPGLTNRILGQFADRIFLTFSASQRWFPKTRTRITGNPVRATLLAGAAAGKRNDQFFTLLIFGGSQGGPRDQPDRRRGAGRSCIAEGAAPHHPSDGGEGPGQCYRRLPSKGFSCGGFGLYHGYGRGLPNG